MSKMDPKFIKLEHKKNSSPHQVFNKKFHPQHITRGSKNFEPEIEGKDILLKGGEVAFEWNADKQMYYTVINESSDWQRGELHTPYRLLKLIACKGNYRSATLFVEREYMGKDIPYIRIATDYFKKIEKVNNYGVKYNELQPWTKDAIKEDHKKNKRVIDEVTLYDGYTIVPDNKNYRESYGQMYNLYNPFPHTPAPGPVTIDDIPVSANFMTHIFGQQADKFGWKYMRALYMEPKRILPVLVLASKRRETGKSTFLKWLNMIFANNYVGISPDDLSGSFNFHYGMANIIGIDESCFEKRKTTEKMKALSTAPRLMLNRKNVSQFEVPFYGKLVLTTNKETDFAKIDKEETRFVVRKVDKIPDAEKIANFEKKILAEVPKFLTYLEQNIEPTLKSKRNGFPDKVLDNDSLQQVKEESKSGLHKEIEEYIQAWFEENPKPEQLLMDVRTIKDRWFEYHKDAGMNKIRKVLNEEMGMEALRNTSYNIMGEHLTKVCSPYRFNRCDYVEPAEQPPHTNGTPDSTDEYPF